jgi:uncharacterized membrane protein
MEPRAGRSHVYERGDDFDRVAFFADAVFAIAMTLLIVSIEVPDLGRDADESRALLDALGDLVPELFGFFLAFLLLARYWLSHHAFFASLRGVDRGLIALNLCYLAFVAFLPFPTALIGRYEQNPISFVVFALALAAISGLEALCLRHAHKAGLFARPLDEATYRYALGQSLVPVAAFVVSIPVAFLDPTVALLSWLMLIPLGIALRRHAPAAARAYDRTLVGR